MTWIAGIDVGGTFTDIVLANRQTGQVRILKVPTSSQNQALAFVAGLEEAGQGIEVDHIVHGTTVGTNALLERKGALVGLVTSAGFRDLLELGRRTRPHSYGMTGEFVPLIPRYARLEVSERVAADGRILVPLDRAALREVATQLKAEGVESVAVMFMHSYANPAHERDARQILEGIWPNDFISLSHEILPEMGEFERVSTTAINAYLQPLLANYLARLERALQDAGFACSFRVMQSNGGALNVTNTVRNAARSVLSGPAAGAIAAAWIGRQIGAEYLVSADMGGTSFDVALIANGQPTLSDRKNLAYGIPTRLPMIDIETIGAGGGSIIYLDESDILHVGPESAGSDPGPICYGRGGQRPTVTDANCLLGRIDILKVLQRPPPMEEVRTAFAHLGEALGTTAEGAAEAALNVVDLVMAGAIRKITLEKGLDPRLFYLLPFGGAGPLHACSIAENLFIPRVLLPPWPGVTSALGCVLAEVRHDDTWAVHKPLSVMTRQSISDLFTRMRNRVLEVLRIDGIRQDDVSLHYEAAMLYEGQARRFMVEVPSPDIEPSALRALFEKSYYERYGFSIDVPVHLASLRVHAAGPPGLDLALSAETARPSVMATEADIMFAGKWHKAKILHRSLISPGDVVDGPARIDQDDTTTLVPPGWSAEADRFGNIEIRDWRAAGGR